MLSALHELLQFSQLTQIVDVGANPIDGEPPYIGLIKNGFCNVIGFEPQQDALAELKTGQSSHENYLPYAVGDGSTKTLNICKYSGWTSTYTPSAQSLNVFSVFKDNAKIIGQTTINTRRLDDIAEIGHIDFLKIDIQGGELGVFQNGKQKLSTASVIQTEVSFFNLYDDQPSFGDIDIELRSQGFIPHCFAAVKKGIIAPFSLNNDPWRPLNQLLEADVVYVKDFRDAESLDERQVKNICLIAHACYGSYDLAYRCILILQDRKLIPADSARRYIDLLNTMLRAVPQK